MKKEYVFYKGETLVIVNKLELMSIEEYSLSRGIPIEQARDHAKKTLLDTVLGLQKKGMTLVQIGDAFVKLLESDTEAST